MYNKRKCVQLLLKITIGCLMLWGFSQKAVAEGTSKENLKRIIYIVYDNSSSTYQYMKENRSYWADINYGVQAFYVMTDNGDEIKFYFMSSDDKLNMSGYGNADMDSNLENIKGIEVRSKAEKEADVTNIEKVKEAIDDLEKSAGDGEKWLVIFTDGLFEDSSGKNYTKEEAAELIDSYLSEESDIKVCYIPISEEAVNDFLDDRIFQPKETQDIAKQLLEVCNYIYNRRSIQNILEAGYQEAVLLEEGRLTITFDIPVSKCLLYVYCDGYVEWGLEEDIFAWEKTIQSPAELNLTHGSPPDGVKSIEKTGFIAEIEVDPGLNNSNYTIDFPEGVSTVAYEIYYEPAISVLPKVRQDNADVVEGKYLAGDYEVELVYQNKKTHNPVSSDSHYLEVEKFDVCVTEREEKKKLGSITGGKRLSGTAQAGEVKIVASTQGICGMTEVEFYKDYAEAKLVANLEDIYYMDLLEQKNQCIWLHAELEGSNITDELQALLDAGEMAELVCYLEKDGQRCDSISFEQQYDTVAKCWKLYPVFSDAVDYSVNGRLDFHAELEIHTDYYRSPRMVYLDPPGSFYTGVSEGEIFVDVANPLEYRIQNFLFPFAERAKIHFLWKGKELPAEALGDITVTGASEDTPQRSYGITGKNKDELKIEGSWLRQGDVVDQLTIQGKAILFGQQKEIYDDSIILQIYGLRLWLRIAGVIFWLFIAGGFLYAAAWIVRFFVDIKNGSRFPVRAKVYRSYLDERNHLKGKITIPMRKKRDRLNEKYAEYTLTVYLPAEFGLDKRGLDILVRRRKKRMEILSLSKPPGCKKIWLGKEAYPTAGNMMDVNEAIILEGEKNTVKIWVECA